MWHNMAPIRQNTESNQNLGVAGVTAELKLLAIRARLHQVSASTLRPWMQTPLPNGW